MWSQSNHIAAFALDLKFAYDIRSRANITRGLDFDHMIKREHTREV
jgi:hypothetical protein